MGITADQIHVWLTVIAILFLQGIALYTWQFRREPGAKWQTYLQVCKAFWLLSVLMIPRVETLEIREAWHSFYTILALAVCYVWLRCVAEMSDFDRHFPVWLMPLTRWILGLFILADLTNGWHRKYWTEITVHNGVAQIHTAVIGYLALAFGYMLIALAMCINIAWAKRCTGLRRRQAATFILPALCAWVGQFLGYLPHNAAFEPHTIGFLLASILMAWAFLRWRAYSVLPLAQHAIANAIVDGLLVVDRDGYIVEINENVRQMLRNPQVKPGAHWDVVQASWPVLAQLERQDTLNDVALEHEDEVRYFMVLRTALCTPLKESLGSIYVFKEVTLEKQQQEQALEQSRAVSMLQERERLGRELHDGPGQIWSFLSAQTQAVRLQMARQRYVHADQLLDELQTIIKDSYIQLRESIVGLNTDLSQGILQALESQLQWYRLHCHLETHLEVNFHWQEGLLSPHAELQVLRILQEALTNSRKSSECTEIKVRIQLQPECLLFEVLDNGKGFEPQIQTAAKGKFGVQIMKDRAREIDADFVIESRVGAGCRITLKVPVRGSVINSDTTLAGGRC